MAADPMPVHRPLLRIIQCTCGEKIPAEDYDQHVRDREPRDIGRWVADAVLASVNLAIARKEPTDG